jgi:hypothetical protein
VARSRRPWPVLVATLLAALVAGSALVTAAVLRADRAGAGDASTTTLPSPMTSGVGVDGCVVEPCSVLATVPVGGTTVQLVADNGATSGRLRIGGAGSSDVIEVTITDGGATLTRDSLECLSGVPATCVVRGQINGQVIGQVVVGRSGKWSSLSQPFVSNAGYLALLNLIPDADPEVLAAQHACDQTVAQDCSTTPVFVEVYNLNSEKVGCTRQYARLESMPGYPAVDLSKATLRGC